MADVMKQCLRRVTLAKFTEFCEHCTLHGAFYLMRRGKCASAAWIAIMAASVALCATLSHVIWGKFSIDPTVTVVESTHYPTERIPFPALMFCDKELVYGPQTSNITHILTSRGYQPRQIEEFFDSITDIRIREYIPLTYVKKMHLLLEDLGFSLKVLHDLLKKPCEKLIIACAWRTKSYNCADMFREVFSVVGHCCQFDIAYFRQNAPGNTTFTAGKETYSGLDVEVNGQQIFANGTVREGSVSIFIFDAANSMTLIDTSISLAPATYFDITLEVYAIDSSKDVKALPLNGRKCMLPSDGGRGISYYQKCISTYMLRQVSQYCKCLPFEHTAQELGVADYQDCTWERYLCVYEMLGEMTNSIEAFNLSPFGWQRICGLENVLVRLRTMVSKVHLSLEKTHADMTTFIHTSECYQKCDYVEYENEVDYINKQINVGEQNNSYTSLTVHFGSNTCMKYRREVLYTWDQMLANLGGIFGLCLGGSIVSIIEVAWFLIDLLFTALHISLRKTKVSPQERKIAFVTQKEVFKKSDNNKDGCYKFMN